MAGGTWTAQNKVRPGAYIRFKTVVDNSLTVGTRGTVAICEPLSWGPVAQVMEIAAGADTRPFTGYDITSPQNRFLREIFKGTDRTASPVKVLLYRPTANGSAQASATIGALTATALYPGQRGNDISVAVTAPADPEGSYTVSTIVDGEIADRQTAAEAADLTANGWVTFSGTGALTASTGESLTGGADGTVQSAAYTAFQGTIAPYKFDVLIYDGTDSAVAENLAAFVERLAEESGQYAQLVASGLTKPDSQYVINVVSGVTLSDGTVLPANQTVWWVGGAEAGAAYNESLTYAAYPGAASVSPLMTNAQYTAALEAGNLALSAGDGTVRVEQDINTLVTFTEDAGKPFRKNRCMRLLSTIANDLYREFSRTFIGQVDNTEDGRSRFQAAAVGYLLDIQAAGGIQNFTAEDVTVEPGEDKDAVVVTAAIQPVDSIEKIYLTVEVT